MCAISSIPTTRLSNQFMTLRVLTQISSDQRGLFGIQNQLASGRRITSPSEDAPAAARAMTLQSLLERKSSVRASLTGIQTRLSAAESAVGSASSILSELRATALSVTGTVVSQQEREAAVAQFNQAIDQLLSIGNQTFQGSYLFSGSQTQTTPFAKLTNGIAYQGNGNSLPAYSDVGQLFSANITGSQVFGGFSGTVLGTADLNPTVAWNSQLTDLNGGYGVRIGSINVSDGTSSRVVNIAGARTLGDVARLLEANPPGTSEVTARVTSRGLEVSLNGGNLSISEVGGGTTAAELGIKRIGGIGPGPIVGADLNPRVTLLTSLENVLGSRARAYLPNVNGGNDVIVEAATSGPARNNVTIKYVDDDWYQATAGLTAGNEFAEFHETPTAATTVLKFPGHPGLDGGIQLTAVTPGTSMNGTAVGVTVRAVDGLGPQFNYDSIAKSYTVSVEAGTTVAQLAADISTSGGPFTAAVTSLGNSAYVLATSDSNPGAGNTYASGNDANTLAVHIDVGQSTANQAIAAIAAEGTFRAWLDPSEEGNHGNGTLVDSSTNPAAVGLTVGGSGTDFDRESGLRITNGGQEFVVDLRAVVTVEDLLNAINGAGANVAAAINAEGTGIDVQSRLSGADFSIGENGGITAEQLGIRTFNGATPLAALNHGVGVRASLQGDDFAVTRRDGETFGIRLAAGNVASARLPGAADAGLLISRAAADTSGNQFSVEIVDSGLGGGNAVSLVGNTLRFNVDVAAGFTAQDAIDTLAANGTLATLFTAQLDRSTDAANDGSGNLAATAIAVGFAGGKGAAVTVEDVLDLINNHPTNLASGPRVIARLSQFGNGIELVDDGPGGTQALSIAMRNSSTAAADLGLISPTSDVSVAPVKGSVASVTFSLAGANNDFVVRARDSGTLLNGTTVHFQNDGVPGNDSVAYDALAGVLTFDVDPATATAQGLVNLLNGHPSFEAALTTLDGGVPNSGAGVLGALPGDATIAGGTADTLTGVDKNPQQVDGVFTALVRLRDAILAGDQFALEEGMKMLDKSTTSLNFARADLGARMQSLDIVGNRIDLENIELRSTLSNEIDVDFAAAVSELALRQASFQASLQVAAQLAQTTLLDYL